MNYIKLFENFTKEKYQSKKKEKELSLIQELGDDFITDIVKDGDFNGLDYLLKTGYDLEESESPNNLLIVALDNHQIKMFEYLLKNYAYINTIIVGDIVDGIHSTNQDKYIVNDKQIDMLKTITEYGFEWKGYYNLIELYLCYYKNNNRILFKNVDKFIDWLLEKYPENSKLLTDIRLPKYIIKKYQHLFTADKYNL